jgi:hypothetical protein
VSRAAPQPRGLEGTARRGRAALAIAAALVGTSGCTAYLARDGAARAEIVLPGNAPSEVRKAAQEISDYARKTTGGALRVRSAGEPAVERTEIRLAVAPPGAPGSRIAHEDGYTIETRNRLVTITGGSPRGTLYGAYDFIERVYGVRWFMPTVVGEDVVKRPTIPLPALDVAWNPAFRSVSGFIWAGGAGANEWELRMRARVGPDDSFGHNFHAILPDTLENRRAYPRAFAVVRGPLRSSQLCTEDPDVVRLSVEAARRHFERHPRSTVFSVSPHDGGGFCEDDRCRKIDARYGVTDGSLTDRFVHFANAVGAEVSKTHPGKQIGVLAYVTHTRPPRSARPSPEYAALVTHMPWSFCHAHAIDDPGCPANRRFVEHLKGWTSAARHVGVYEYYGHFFAFTPWPIVRNLRRDLPFLASLGIERFISETQQNWANQGLNFYVAAKLASDPARDADALLAEYYDRFYGPASAPMRRYWERFETAMAETVRTGDGGYVWLSMFRRPLAEAAAADLAEAGRLATAEPHQTRVAFARLGFAYTEAVTEMFEAHYRGDLRAVLEWTEKAVERVKRADGSAPQAFFTSLAVDQTRYLSSLLTSSVRPWDTLRPSRIGQ